MDKNAGPTGEDGAPVEFPKGIEGTRGPKDSARGARDFYIQQRGLSDSVFDPTAHGPAGADPAGEDAMATSTQQSPVEEFQYQAESEDGFRAGSLGATFTEAERFLAMPMLMPDVRPEAPEEAPAANISISIAGVRTVSQAGNQTVFLHTTDALALVLDLAASQDLVNSGAKFDANFQIIEFATNNVKVNQWWRSVPFAWGMYFWISQGNNWGPNPSDYTTPQKWGLVPGLYFYRATVEVQGLNAFSFSQEQTLRVR